MSRSKRKIDHIEHALSMEPPRQSSMDDIAFVHNALPGLNVDDISLDASIGELTFSSPIFINAMTGGGGKETEKINRQLAQVANVFNIPMAVGSQMAAIRDPKEQQSYKVVRQYHPRGVVFANVGSEATVDQAKFCVDLLEADAIQIHLNVIQELVMPEGDRAFRGALERVEKVSEGLEVPVIVKEVGFGIGMEAARALRNAGVAAIDVGGRGGTDFSWIENQRRDVPYDFFDNWGTPTAAAIVESSVMAGKLPVLATGGIQTSMDVAKSIALGASAAGMAGHVLKWLRKDGLDKTIQNLDRLMIELKTIMTALGARSVDDLQKVPLVIKGETYHWLSERSIDTKQFAGRGLQ